jgi:GH35 family endo-1,4-beta-xylanase
MAPVYCRKLNELYDKRITEIAQHYGGRVHSWDIVNESAIDFHGNSNTGEPINVSNYKRLMAGDYVYKAFKAADNSFQKHVMLNINDYANNENYTNQVKDLMAKGCKIDIMGSQMHLFNPQQCLDIADGKEIQTPKIIYDIMNTLSKANVPIHLSEITITAPNNDERGQAIQAVIARNLYRLWFSIEKMMGITWWNVVDDCGAPGEPSVSGLFTRNMKPKPAFFALNKLINEEWKTTLIQKTDSNKTIKFRGFKGNYRISWKDKSGNENTAYFYLKEE